MEEMLKVYCDTNVFVDYYQAREDYIRPLSLFAFEFFSKGWNCRFKLVVSDHLINELSRHLKKEQIDEILGYFKHQNSTSFITGGLLTQTK